MTIFLTMGAWTGASAQTPPIYVITGSGTTFTATKDGGTTVGTADLPIQTVINTIKSDVNGAACTIQFGDGGTTLDIGTANINFNNSGTPTWGSITLTGKITSVNTSSTSGTITLSNNVSVESQADIENTYNNANARAIYNNSTGMLTVSDGTVSATLGRAIHNQANGTVEVTGGTVSTTSGYGAVFNNAAGAVNISGGIVSTASGRAVYNSGTSGTGTVNISGGTVRATGSDGIGVYGYHNSGDINVSGNGTVSSATGNAIYVANGGKISVSDNAKITASGSKDAINILQSDANIEVLNIIGGTVENTGSGNAVYLNSKGGSINISGGTISGNTGSAVYMSVNDADLTVSGNALITSAKSGFQNGTIYYSGKGIITVTGGTIKNTETSSTETCALCNGANGGTGTVNISGGTITAISGIAFWNIGKGIANISGGVIKSISGRGIRNGEGNSGATAELNISAGNVTSETGDAIYNHGGGAVNISGTAVIEAAVGRAIYNYDGNSSLTVSGGTIKTTSGYAVYNSSSTTITLGGSPTIIGVMRFYEGKLSVDPTFIPGSAVYTLALNTSPPAVGAVAVVNGGAFPSNFGLYNQTNRVLAVSGSNLVVAAGTPAKDYVIIPGGTGTTFTATKGGITMPTATDLAIQDVIEAIRADANKDECSIQFGNNVTALDIGAARIEFNGINDWGLITLKGKLTSSSTSVIVSSSSYGVSIISNADIATTGSGNAINNQCNYCNTTLTISGGTVSAVDGAAILDNRNGTVLINGGTVSSISGNAVDVNGKLTIDGSNATTITTETGIAVSYSGSDPINILGGTVTATQESGKAISSVGTVNISGGYVSAVGTAVLGYGGGVLNITGGTVNASGGNGVACSNFGEINISGGTVTAMGNNGVCINHNNFYLNGINVSGGMIKAGAGKAISIDGSWGQDLNITGGTVSAEEGIAVYYANISTGIGVMVSGDAKITSKNSDPTKGTIYFDEYFVKPFLISGGIVENTAPGGGGNAVYNAATSLGFISLVYNPTINGAIKYNPGQMSVDNTFAPGGNIYTLSLISYYNGAVAVFGGAANIANFTLDNHTDHSLVVSGGNIAVKSVKNYVITGSNGAFTAKLSGGTIVGVASQPIQNVIEAIKIDASGEDCSIQFGSGGSDVLDIGLETITFNDAGWGIITLTGKLTSGSTSVVENSMSIISKADITTTGTGTYAIKGNGYFGGSMTIAGGTVSAPSGVAVYINDQEKHKLTIESNATY